MTAAQLELSLDRECGQEDPSVVSPYLQRPLRSLSEAKHDHDSALLDLTATDRRLKPAASPGGQHQNVL
jgi:hypothetical protein